MMIDSFHTFHSFIHSFDWFWFGVVCGITIAQRRAHSNVRPLVVVSTTSAYSVRAQNSAHDYKIRVLPTSIRTVLLVRYGTCAFSNNALHLFFESHKPVQRARERRELRIAKRWWLMIHSLEQRSWCRKVDETKNATSFEKIRTAGAYIYIYIYMVLVCF